MARHYTGMMRDSQRLLLHCKMTRKSNSPKSRPKKGPKFPAGAEIPPRKDLRKHYFNRYRTGGKS
jgi:hypothetical protein